MTEKRIRFKKTSINYHLSTYFKVTTFIIGCLLFTSNTTFGGILPPQGTPNHFFKMAYFSVENQQVGTILTWQTVAEKNNKGFEIQRSTDEKQWRAIGYVHSGGQLANIKNYTFRDQSPVRGVNYYRLKFVTPKGVAVYSNVLYMTVE